MHESILANPSLFTRTIAGTQEYLKTRSAEQDAPGAIRRAVALGSRALAESHTTESGYKSPEACVYDLISTIDDFAQAERQLAMLGETEASRAERLPHIRSIIRFNHAAKALIDSDPSIGFNQLVTFTVRMHEAMHRDEPGSGDDAIDHANTVWLQNAVSDRLHGMRSELAVEQILWAIDDDSLEYDETTIEDELHGIDLFITQNGRRYGIDIKASQAAVDKARLTSSHPARIIWSQVSWEDFNGGFRISDELARKKAPALKRALSGASRAA